MSTRHVYKIYIVRALERADDTLSSQTPRRDITVRPSRLSDSPTKGRTVHHGTFKRNTSLDLLKHPFLPNTYHRITFFPINIKHNHDLKAGHTRATFYAATILSFPQSVQYICRCVHGTTELQRDFWVAQLADRRATKLSPCCLPSHSLVPTCIHGRYYSCRVL